MAEKFRLQYAGPAAARTSATSSARLDAAQILKETVNRDDDSWRTSFALALIF